MSNNEAIKVLAEREGWTADDVDPSGRVLWWTDERGLPQTSKQAAWFLTSRDAIAPVLAKLTDEEWRTLDRILTTQWTKSDANWRAQSSFDGRKWILTLPPEQLAHAVAEAIVACKAKGAA